MHVGRKFSVHSEGCIVADEWQNGGSIVLSYQCLSHAKQLGAVTVEITCRYSAAALSHGSLQSESVSEI